ncbi:MAG: TetR/AcrR family transcriptional regulator [Cyanobacteria bacterium SID2]|nr:TetR/AcrR family transcriptional regulator [Cyanobacteria bacterium SID2]MBP0006657.1 TetR/AcrR family transcriptional regulator [Cyanobacteria bacterium SBC]
MSNSTRNASKRALLKSAATVLARNPGSSLSDIAAQAGVGRATLYRYFPSRDELVRELALEAMEEIDRVTERVRRQNLPSQAALLAFLEEVVPLGDRFHFLVSESVAYTDPDIAAAYTRQMSELDEFVTTLKQDGVLGLDIPNAWVTSAIDALIWAAWSSVDTGYIARKDAAVFVYRTLIKGLAPS